MLLHHLMRMNNIHLNFKSNLIGFKNLVHNLLQKLNYDIQSNKIKANCNLQMDRSVYDSLLMFNKDISFF